MGGLHSKEVSRKPQTFQTLGPSSKPSWDKTKNPAPINKTCDVIQLFLKYLCLEDLSRVAGTCRQWAFSVYELVNKDYNLYDLCRLSNLCNRSIPPKFRVIGPAEWEKCGLPSIPSPPFNQRTAIPKILHLLKKLPVEGNAGGTLLILPEAFSLRKLEQLMKAFKKTHPEEGSAGPFKLSFSLDHSTQMYYKTEVTDSRIVYISNSVVLESRNRDFDVQRELLKKFGCRIPSSVEVATLVLLVHALEKECLFGKKTYTHCLDEEERARIIMGGFVPKKNGLFISLNDVADPEIGVCAVCEIK